MREYRNRGACLSIENWVFALVGIPHVAVTVKVKEVVRL
jgi:hypothetical protein